jgi:hypothetical protein
MFMMTSSFLSGYEWILVTTLITIALISIWIMIKIDRIGLLSPLPFIVAAFLFYCVAGPWMMLSNEWQIFPEKFIRPFYTRAWEGSLVSLISLLAGYFFFLKKISLPDKTPDYSPRAFRMGALISLLGIALYAVADPARFLEQLNPFTAGKTSFSLDPEGFSNYLNLCLNFSIAGSSLMLISRKRAGILHIHSWVMILIISVVMMLFLSQGFRFRMVVLLVSLFISYYLLQRKVPSTSWFVLLIPAIITLMGLIGTARNYGYGLELSRVTKSRNLSLFAEGFRDANIFPISGAVMTSVPERVPYHSYRIIRNILLTPVPSAIAPDKDIDGYIRKPIRVYAPLRDIKAHEWAAMLFFAEWYIIFGWVGLIFISFALGAASAGLWNYVRRQADNRYALTIYATAFSFIFVFITRGYTPFAITTFFFMVLPAFVLQFWSKLRWS